MIAHENALDWQELFELAVLQGTSEDDLKAMAYRVAGMAMSSASHPSAYIPLPKRTSLPRSARQKRHRHSSNTPGMSGKRL